ncbi:hypothetical protein CA51_31860 [Rosistilla oblonga]|uniref:WXG100 family type VII secretion target n=3 Tax=Rosistilla TaxID=2795779 RepID=A0A518IZJ5_9BACT|nr:MULTISPECIES: WXG100 family type VII secretion target [Rosistilla]QDS88282.1 hypothetical protein EC9_24720 [Rosistilla ulvae]QDV13298.1 hypothetical protein CA51_31860 [Rosistilla oblonga]QDV58507.1 hypothetical protein Mal33_45300 [Rosistilla oblonga]QDV69603.1 hypothetical protein Poly24_33190 [Rosistilla carotiformis]
MSQAIVNPDHLRQFAGNLKVFTEELQQRAGSLSSQMNQLGESWRDQQHRRFAAEFEDELRQMARFVQSAEQHIPYLLRKADQIDAYLKG